MKIKNTLRELIPDSILEQIYLVKGKVKVETIIFLLGRFYPLKKNKIVLCNFRGRGYGDNPKYIAEELLKIPDLDLVWLVNDIGDKSIPSKIRKVLYGSLRAYWELATAKIWIDNTRKEIAVSKRKKQYYINTGHGGIPLKMVEGDVDNLGPIYTSMAKHDSKMINLFISNSSFRTQLYHNSYWYKGEVGTWGAPKIEQLQVDVDNKVRKVRNYFNILESKKILLYAPTFRDDGNIDMLIYNWEDIISNLQCSYGGEWIVFIRLHPNVANKAQKFWYDDKVINATIYNDMQELMLASDILITDYSGIMFEMMLIGKPVFLYTEDINSYSRGFYFDLHNLPFPMAETVPQLIDNINDYDHEEYLCRVRKFKDGLGIVEKYGASKKCVERIEMIIRKERR